MGKSLAGLWCALLFASVGWVPAQQPEPGLVPVSGRLFVDMDANGQYEEGEPVLGGISIEFADGEQIVTIATAADGSFALQVEPGLWRATLRPPEGFEYTLPEGIELEVLEAAEGELSLQIGLQPVQLLEVLVNALESEQAGAEDEPAPEAVDESADPSDPEVEPEVYDGPFTPPDESVDPGLLPESGGSLPPRLLVLGGAVGLLTAGALLWVGGRLLQRRQLAGGRGS